jgi:hypothetical protein
MQLSPTSLWRAIHLVLARPATSFSILGQNNFLIRDDVLGVESATKRLHRCRFYRKVSNKGRFEFTVELK